MAKTWKEALEWYRTHQSASEIGFNPDGMCLKVSRTARGIDAMYPSAVQAQNATPEKHRITRVRDLRRGMVLYFDDPNDSNTFGHICTMVGRVKDFDWDSLDDVLVETNSVVSGELVVVRASYFKKHWADAFQFGSDYLNGVEFDYAGKNQTEKPAAEPEDKPEGARIRNFRESAPEWDVKILDRAVKAGRSDLKRFVNRIDAAVDGLPHDEDEDTRVHNFKERFEVDRVLDIRLLDKAITDSDRTGAVKKHRDELNSIIKQVLTR